MELKTIIENKADLIKFKKATVKRFTKGLDLSPTKVITFTSKDLPNDEEDKIYRKIIGNTYNFMDNHDDVHLSKSFAKSISENMPFILADHKFDVTAKIGKALAVQEEALSWEQLGVDKEGTTESLTADIELIKALNENVFYQYKNNMINQHSVGMQYVKVDLAINDTYDKQGFENWGKYLPLLGNPEIAEGKGYFWIVQEAKLFEISAVLQGSNALTQTIDNNELIDKIYNKFGDIEKFYEFCNITPKEEPIIITPTQEPIKKNFYKHLITKK
jgi:hypothetical protein